MNKKIFFTAAILAMVYFSNAQTWSTYGTGLGPLGFAEVYGTTMYNGKLIVTGQFYTAGSDSAWSVAQWDGTAWDSVGHGIVGDGYSMCEYNGNLLVGGQIISAGKHPVNNIAQWNGTSWLALGSGILGNSPFVYALCVYNGNLYAAGIFDTAGGHPVNNIAEWNGSTWSAVGSGVTDTAKNTAVINSLAVYNGELYAGGYFDTAGGVAVNGIAKWNGSSWSAVGTGGMMYNSGRGAVSALCVYEGSLCAAGIFDNAGGVPANNIAKWNGTSWDSLGSGIAFHTYYYRVSCLTSVNHILYAGGRFNKAGSAAVNNVAQWDGANWSPMTDGIIGYYIDCAGTYGSQVVYGGDIGNINNTVVVNAIANWTGGSPPATSIC